MVSFSTCRCRGFPKGSVKVGCCDEGGRGAFGATTGPVELLALAAFSAFSFNCLNLLKYRSEANSVMWRGSIWAGVWPLCHPVAEMRSGTIDKACQEGRGATLFTGGSSVSRPSRREEQYGGRRTLDAHASWDSRPTGRGRRQDGGGCDAVNSNAGTQRGLGELIGLKEGGRARKRKRDVSGSGPERRSGCAVCCWACSTRRQWGQ
jgi:hypothetical protein